MVVARKKNLLKVVILGDSGVGKSALMSQFVNNKFDSDSQEATIGPDFLTKDFEVDGNLVTLQIWDTAGQERFLSLGSALFRGADACMLVFDLTSQRSFSHLSSWHDEFLLRAREEQGCVLIGNKNDMEDKRVISQKAAVAWTQEHAKDDAPIPYFETSAKEKFNVEQAFMAVAKIALRRKLQMDNDNGPEIPTLKPIAPLKKTGKKKCCA